MFDVIFNKRKCEQYWPSLGRTIISGKIDITTVDETNYAFFTIRKLKVTNSQVSLLQSAKQ